MRTAIQLAAEAGPWDGLVDYVVESERLGVDVCWVAEAWGCDAPSALGYLAARTDRILLGSGILQVGTRSPVMTAMTAMTLARISGDRFLLGLGSSGPQVIEGLHGVPFAHPLGRMRETIEIARKAFGGERLAYEGDHFELPRAGGEGKALRLSQPPNPRIPVYLAALSPGMLRLTGEVADGWLGTSFVPEAAGAYLEAIGAGAASAGRSVGDIDICQGAEVAFGDDVDAMVAARKPGLAFTLGGMGSATTNFYNRAYARQGWSDVADEVQRLWVSGRHDDAAARVPDEMVLATTLIGTEAMVRDRLAAWQDAGVTTIRLYPAGEGLDERLTTLARALELLNTVGDDRARGPGALMHRLRRPMIDRTRPESPLNGWQYGRVGETYTHGHHESVLRSHTWRTAENSAGYLLGSLEPGQRLLDVGCGPGTITLDLAARVAPGAVIGIDAEAEVIARAEDLRREQGTGDVTFATGDVYALDFADASFDVVHAHQVLQHLSDPIAALAEMRRVLRPGGILGVRDSDYGAWVWAPPDATLDRWLELYHLVTARNGADADAGRRLLGWVQAAGFGEVRASSSTWTIADDESRRWWGGLWSDRVQLSSFADQAVDYGLAGRDELATIAEAWRRWAEQPDGFLAILHCEVLARR